MDEQRKKVLYVITKDDVGGAQKYVSDLASHLDAQRFDVKIVRGGIDIPALSNKISWRTFFLNDWKALIGLVRLYRKEKPDIIHLNSSKAGVVGSFAAGIYKLTSNFLPNTTPQVIFTAHGWVFNPSNALSPLLRKTYILLHTCAAYFEDAIICVSAYDAELARTFRIAPADKLIVITNGIAYENLAFLGKVSARRELTTKLGVRGSLNDMPWIGSIGRLTKEKDYATFIQALHEVPHAYGFIIGEGSEKEKLTAEIARLEMTDRFFIVTPTNEDALYLKAFDIFTLTSIKEGLPYALLEAMGAGLPAVVTNAGGMSEAVIDGVTGKVASQKDAHALGAAFKELLGNNALRTEYGKEAQKRIRERFSFEQMLKKTETLYTFQR
jgi:glycosyltransferase involved in cell wall biosynthesis